MATLSELKQQATDLGISFKAKILKADLEALVKAKLEALSEFANRAFVDANSVRLPPRLVRASAPRNVPLTNEARIDNYQRQNGTTRLSAPQRRRAAQKANRAR